MKIAAVSSGGGHWIELLRLLPAFDGHEVTLITVSDAYREQAGALRFLTVNDATRWNKLALLVQFARLCSILLRLRPQVVVTTGAAPGYFALRIGRWLGARTVWVDSIANAEELSGAGRRAGRHADLWLTQWEHLAQPGGPRFEGAVL